MKSIYKYPLPGPMKLAREADIIRVTGGIKPVTVALQMGEPMVWIQLDMDDDETHVFEFRTVGTGLPFEDDGFEYLSTFQLMGGVLVLHVYWRKVS